MRVVFFLRNTTIHTKLNEVFIKYRPNIWREPRYKYNNLNGKIELSCSVMITFQYRCGKTVISLIVESKLVTK